MQISKAVITAAGRGVRQYPASDTVQKAMLPLVDRDGLTKPVLQIIAEEALESGIEEICFVSAPGDEAVYTLTTWVDIDGLLSAFRLTHADLTRDPARVAAAVRAVAARIPTYVTIKDVK